MATRLSCCAARFVFVLIFTGLAAFDANSQTQVNIGASKDNTLYENASGATSNGAGEHFFVGRTNQGSGSIRRGIIAFNIVGSVPANATITGVTLTLNMSKTNAGAQTVTLHRVGANWGEGTSDAGGNEGGGAPATTNDATWIHRFFSDSTWAGPGGQYIPTPRASLSVGGVASYTWVSTAGMVSDVQQWLNTPSTNFGWVVLGNESAGATAKRFDSKENGTTANRPILTVTYTTPNAVDENQPHAFALHQNYPNPFNPATTITFQLASRSQASLRIFNLLGQEIATLVNAELPTGPHSFRWNAEGFSSGVYVYQLEAEGFLATRKLVLTR